MKNPVYALVSDLKRILRRGTCSLGDPSDSQIQREPAISVLAITASVSDQNTIRVAALSGGWKLSISRSIESALQIADTEFTPVVLCDIDLPGNDWRNTIKRLLSLPGARCVILTASAANDDLWQSVIQRGGYDVLPKPLHHEELIRIVRQGHSWTQDWTATSPRYL